MRGPDVGVADERHVAAVLYSHDADESVLFLAAVEDHAVLDLAAELETVHVRVVPAVLGYDALVGLGRR
jgi:hypothetical protein